MATASTSNPRIRGLVLVICNSFVNTLAEQVQLCETDLQTMKRLWGDMLKCHSFPSFGGDTDFIVHRDVSAKEMLNLFTDFSTWPSKTQSPTKYAYVAVVISTHGGQVANSWAQKWDPTCETADLRSDSTTVYYDYQEYVREQDGGMYVKEEMVEVLFGNDFRPIREEKIKKLFHNNAAKGWQDVPKFFILSYCRGNAADKGVIHIPEPAKAMALPIDSRAREISIHRNNEEAVSLLPEISDVLVVYAAQRSYLAYGGGRESGSWLVTTIGNVFSKYAKKMHVVDMLTLVNRDMKAKEAKRGWDRMKAMSIYESSLENNLYLCDEAKLRGDRLAEELEIEMKQEDPSKPNPQKQKVKKRDGVGDHGASKRRKQDKAAAVPETSTKRRLRKSIQ